MKKKRLYRLLEFALVGVVMGMAEDLLAVRLVTDKPINLRVIWVVLLVALPFAFISEFVVDDPRFLKSIFKKKK